MTWSHLAAFVAGILVSIWTQRRRCRRLHRPVFRTRFVSAYDGRTLLDLSDEEAEHYASLFEDRDGTSRARP